MARFDRYMLSQLIVLFGFFALVLVSVYWVNRAVRLFDTLISSGESALVFLEFTALILPSVIRLMLPIAAIAATVYAVNRLASDSELIIVQATGFSPWRMARPVIFFGIFVAAMSSILNHVLAPASLDRLTLRQAQVAENVTARLLTPGTFLNPADGVTFYIRDISPVGELRDVFMSDARRGGERIDYSAERALLIRGEAGPTLLMFDGMAQRLDTESRLLSVTRFSDLAYDIGGLITIPSAGARDVSQLSTAELLWQPPEILDETGETPARLTYEANLRFAEALMRIAAPLLGFAILLVGGFSRFGMWRQIVGAVVALALLELIRQTAAGTARSTPGGWPLTYAGVAVGFAAAAAILWLVAHPDRFRRTRRAVPPVPEPEPEPA